MYSQYALSWTTPYTANVTGMGSPSHRARFARETGQVSAGVFFSNGSDPTPK
jgi:hypothetical protein